MIAIKGMTMPRNCYECWFEDANQCYLNILQHIESLDRPDWCPLVEAEPVKHGRWIYGERMPFGVNVFAVKCSECSYNTVTDGLRHKYNYCPNCGAKMDLDEVENG